MKIGTATPITCATVDGSGARAATGEIVAYTDDDTPLALEEMTELQRRAFSWFDEAHRRGANR